MSLTVRFIGTGDAFASGGRFQTCIMVEGGDRRFLLDCGASSLIAMRRQGIDPGDIDAILFTHFHGDHHGGIPLLILDGFVSGRERPLTVAGPPGSRVALEALGEALFPGMTKFECSFPLEITELEPGSSYNVAGLVVTPFPAAHFPETHPLALRVECAGKIIAFSGDGEWVDDLVPAARDADLFIVECNFFDSRVPNHMDYRTLTEHLSELGAKRVILTHLGREVLDNLASVECEYAEDGMTVEI